MSQKEVVIARIYLHEAQHLLKKIIGFLHDDEHVSGVTVLRGIAGFGDSGKIHTASLVDLSLDSPLTVEFYAEPEKSQVAIAHLKNKFGLKHIVSWSAFSH
jgi:PII-like signaling protein